MMFWLLSELVNTPKRGIGEKAQQKIQQVARDNQISLARAARLLLDKNGLSGKAGIQLDLFLKNYQLNWL